jgi:hypothetical protein
MPNKVQKVMHEFKTGSLNSSSGKKVTNRKQAIAIALSEARAAGQKVSKRPRSIDDLRRMQKHA